MLDVPAVVSIERLIMLPLMLFQPIQLLVRAVITGRQAREVSYG